MDWLFKDHSVFILALAVLILQRNCNFSVNGREDTLSLGSPLRGNQTIMCNCDPLVAGRDTISLGSSLREKQTIISKNGTFELGFFNPNGTSNWYVGIWYAQISEKTIIWVANRETPIKNMPGVFSLSKSGYLSVSDLEGEVVWSSNDTQQTQAASMASILDTGNFVLLDPQNSSETVWESFSHPTDHFMPAMKLWKGLRVTAWKSSKDPAAGPFSLQLNPSLGKKDFVLMYKSGVSYCTSGDWNGKYFSALPYAGCDTYFVQELVQFSPTNMYYRYDLTPKARSTRMGRAAINFKGECTLYFLINNKWNLVYTSPQSDCGMYGVCGAYGVCFIQENVQLCRCMDGFHPRNATSWSSNEWWSSGCVRDTPLNCSSINGNGDISTSHGFLQVSDKSLSGEEPFQIISELSTVPGCKTACLDNCSCMAFALTDSNPADCKLWFGDLLSLQTKVSSLEGLQGQSLFIRLAASDVSQLSAKTGRRSRVVALYIAISVGVTVLATLFIAAWFIQRKRRRLLQKVEDYDTPTTLRTFTYRELKIATNNFAHMLGKGAFGSVFRGTLPDNAFVAVKRLESSGPAEKQFRAEIGTIGNIHHVNLVRLRGFCAERSNRMLVYEYMQNGSLNAFLSPKAKEEDKVLDWKTRFEIALGTARGLLYLHEECRDSIIHCDVKPENILLDADFSPKVADFGLAKIVGRDFSRVLTTTRGTRGYLAPEWLTGVPITVKVDVYSFGMTLLEIISGRRNLDLSVQESQYYFPTWAATQIHKGNVMGIVDERIVDKADIEEVRRAVVVSILCIQEDENGRPSMGQVVRMLEGISEGDVEQYKKSLQALVDDH